MDKVFSARIDEGALSELDLLSRRLKTSKKAVLERAIRTLAEQVGEDANVDVLAATSGAWQRAEEPAKTVERSRKEFRRAMERHRR